MNKKTVFGALMMAAGLGYGLFVFPEMGMDASPIYFVPAMFLVFGGLTVLSLGLKKHLFKYIENYGMPYEKTFMTMDLGVDPLRAAVGSTSKLNSTHTFYHFKDTGIHIVKIAENGLSKQKLFETEAPVNSLQSFHISGNAMTGNMTSMTLAPGILPDNESTTGKALYMAKARNQFDNAEGTEIIRGFAARHNIPIDSQEAQIL